VREVDGDAVLGRSDNLPDAVLVGRVQLRERRTLNGPVSGVDVTSTRVFTTHDTRSAGLTMWHMWQMPRASGLRGASGSREFFFSPSVVK